MHVLELEPGSNVVYDRVESWSAPLRNLELLPRLDVALASHANLRAVIVYSDVPANEQDELKDILAARMPQVHRARCLHIVNWL